MVNAYNICNEIDPHNALQRHFDTRRYIDEWDEVDEDEINDGLDPAFSSWEEVNGMFFTRKW